MKVFFSDAAAKTVVLPAGVLAVELDDGDEVSSDDPQPLTRTNDSAIAMPIDLFTIFLRGFPRSRSWL